MRRKLLVMLIVVLAASTAVYAAMSYGGDNYRKYKARAFALNYNVDPLWQFMNEVETAIEAFGLESGTTIVASTGVQSTTTAVTATTGGGTTGLIPANARMVVITSDSADKQVTLPSNVAGMQITLITGATACEVICADAGAKINDVVCGATNEAALVADSHYDCTAISATEWIMVGYDKLGAHVAPIVPDAL